MRDGWVETSLGEIAEVVGGGTPSTTIGEYWDGDIVWLTPTEITSQDGTVVSDSIRKITDLGFKNSGAQMLPRDSVILTSRASVGFVALSGKELCTNQGFQSLIPKPSVLSKFLMFWIQQNRPEFESRSAGSTFKEISKSNVKSIKLQLPPLPEQKRIVDLISSVDSYIEALQQQLETAKRSRNAVLHELLTAGGEDWVETRLGDASEVIMGRQLSPSKKLGTRPRPYIRAANIGSWGINLEDIYEMDFTEIEEERFACQVGDTILVEGGNEKSVGCPAFITEKESGLCIQNTVIRCRSTNPKILEPNFQYHLLRFMFWRGDFAQLCAGTTIMHLGQKRAEVVPISIPPIGEQLDIVDTISKFDLVVTNLEKTLDNAKTLRSGLLSDLLSGEHEIPASYDKVMGAA
jgi:type I restriction enzyme S subunit